MYIDNSSSGVNASLTLGGHPSPSFSPAPVLSPLPYPPLTTLPPLHPSPPLPLEVGPALIQLGGLGSAVISPSGVWGGAPAEIEFDAALKSGMWYQQF